MKRLFFLLPVLGLVAACADKGRCFEQHYETQPAYVYTTVTTYDGKNFVPVMQYMPESTYSVCDRWEFPEGRT